MTITHKDLMLRTITVNDLELLRHWRNAEHVNQHLVTRKIITAGEQINWFHSLNPENSIYYMILSGNKAVGLIYAHNINVGEKSFEGSIYIGDEKYADSFIAVQAALLLTLFFFEHLHFRVTYSLVHHLNTKALDLDSKLGYKEISREGNFIKSICHRVDFMTAAAPYIKSFLKNDDLIVNYETGDKLYSFIR